MTARNLGAEDIASAADYRDLLEFHAATATTPLKGYFAVAAKGIDALIGMHMKQDFRDAAGKRLTPAKAWLQALAPLNELNAESLDPHDADARDRWENALYPAYTSGFRKILAGLEAPPPPPQKPTPFNPLMNLSGPLQTPPTARFHR